MEQKLSKIFKEMKEIEPKEELRFSIMRKINLEKSRRMRRMKFLSYFGIAVSFSAAAYALIFFGSAFFKSEFWTIFSLIFSDAMIVLGNWKEYLYSLGETFPVVNIILILVPIFSFLMFLNLLISLKNNKHIHKHMNMQAFQH